MDESPAWLAPSDEETMLLVVITESGLEREIHLKITPTKLFYSKIYLIIITE